MVAGCTIAGAILAAILKFDPYAARFVNTPAVLVVIVGALIGLGVAAIAIALDLLVHRVSLGDLVVVMFGLVIGAAIAWLILYAHVLLPDYLKEYLQDYNAYFTVFKIAVYLTFVYVGIIVAARGRAEFSLFVPRVKLNREGTLPPLVIDTSAIIDGRIVELYKTGFMRHKIIVPEFVLHELQIVSDSQVPLTRAKGRRGLETLKRLQDLPQPDIEVTGLDFPEVREVDDKLMKLAKDIDAIILTTDYNLEQVAKIQHIPCLNIFALVNALKAPFIPGEHLTLQIVKEGSEPNQGVGFLDDGTMIVVSNARHSIGQRVDVELVSMIQGASGRIFFADITETGSANDSGPQERNSRGSDRRRS
jgi:uncharacterized protein YacL